MASPAISGRVSLARERRITPIGTGRPVSALRNDYDGHLAGDAPTMVAACDLCAARTRCPIASCLATGSVSPDSSFLKRRVFRRGEHIFREGDVTGTVYAVQSGTVKSYITANTGDEHIVTFRSRGDLLGLAALAAGVHTASARALETVSVCGISRSRLEALGNRFPGWLHRLLARELVRNRITLLTLRRKDARSRLAAFLLDLSGRFRVRGQSRQAFNLNMSRQDIGNHLGMTIETLCRALSYFRKARLIDIDHRRVTIRDFDTLHSFAGIQEILDGKVRKLETKEVDQPGI